MTHALDDILVLKLGSSVLRTQADLPRAVHAIYREWRHGRRVVAVVSALGSTTDELLSSARQLVASPQPSSLAALLATGETTAAALLTLALQRSGIPATLLDAAAAGLRTRGDALDAEPVALDTQAIRRALATGSVVVVPGFSGRDAAGATTLLGRGGSDLTAVFLARELGAACTLLKDVDGVRAEDPAARPDAPRFASITWQRALRVGRGVVQPKALRLAESAGLGIRVTSAHSSGGTLIGAGPERIAPSRPRPAPPLRVALLGCGTVGGGVLERLLAMPETFTVTGVAVRDVARHAAAAHARVDFTSDWRALVREPCDVVVELMGGDAGRDAIVAALRAGRDVVTANKAALTQGDDLPSLAASRGASLRHSASVGGALPALELVRRSAGRVRSLRGILNGTSNFVLDAIAAGSTLGDAVARAQAAGYAEADPAEDLDGTDAARKLVLLAREAFGARWSVAHVERRGIADVDAAAGARRGGAWRLVATCTREGARVRPERLAPGDPLAPVAGAMNALCVELEDGRVVTCTAQGAGRWPTTEAVIADLLDAHLGDARATAERSIA